MYIYIYMCTTRTHTRTHTHTHAPTHPRTHAPTYTHTHTQVYANYQALRNREGGGAAGARTLLELLADGTGALCVHVLVLCVVLFEVLREFAAGDATVPVRVNRVKRCPQLLLAAADVDRHSNKLLKVESAIGIHICRRKLAILLAPT